MTYNILRTIINKNSINLRRTYCTKVTRICGVIIGPPGSGKGTIANRIVNDFQLSHFSSGDILRGHIVQKTDIGKKIEKIVHEGHLVPFEMLAPLVETEVKNCTTPHGWLLDGYPRSVQQAESLHKACAPNFTLYLNVPFETIVDRIKARWVHMSSGRVYNTEFNPPEVHGVDDITGEELVQREDDKPESVLKRLQVYQAMISPVLKFYKDHGILQEFVGTETNVIYPNVKEFLEEHIEFTAQSTT